MKKIIAMILCLLMVFSCAAALGEEPVTIEVIQRKLVDANEDNIILREFEKRLGLKIDYTGNLRKTTPRSVQSWLLPANIPT